MRNTLSLTGSTLLLVIAASTLARADGLGVAQGDQIRSLDGFEVELVYEVPREQEGSWVSLTVDPKGRLITCDQYGQGLFRVDVSGDEAKVERLNIDLKGAQGLLYAFDALYANVNSNEFPPGVWRLTDTDGDDQFDSKEHIVPLKGGGEHGPHAMILTPDGKRIIMSCGNNTDIPSTIASSRVPRVWDEDHLLGRMPDARGHNAGRMAPGGFIASFNPDGSEVELIATGFRNEYDIAINRDGELFAFDADMEWDVGTPWYRPTRINHVISGAEFGWRNGTGKWPDYYPDSFGAAVNIGAGSPTGICFGYGTKFPKKYQEALYVCDWSYGNIHVVHLTPDGSTYGGSYENFATAAPLAVTDIVVHPDGALYFTVGGRGSQSALYRIRYTGDLDQSADAEVDATVAKEAAKLRSIRKQIESGHVGPASTYDLALAMDHLHHEDRGIRFAARISIEHQRPQRWREDVFALEEPQALILGMIALARHGDRAEQPDAVAALTAIDWDALSPGTRVDLLRAYALIAIRLDEFKPAQVNAILEQIDGRFPTGDHEVDRELAQLLVYLEAPDVVARVVGEMLNSPSQENQIHYAMALRGVTDGWTNDLRRQYFQWFNDIRDVSGGMSFGGFIQNIKNASLANVSEAEKKSLADVLERSADPNEPVSEPRNFVKSWQASDLVGPVTDSDFIPNFEQGKQVFGAAQCYKCHRIGIQGGILGPDLTGAGGRYGAQDILVSILEPDKQISDQYGATQFVTDDGRVIVGRVVNLNRNGLQVMTNMLDPSKLTGIQRATVESTKASPLSMMPSGLLDTFNQDEIANLIAYLRAGGDANHEIYAD